jgi:VCBS repeat-containing protein
VDVPVPAEGERLTMAVLPGDALRLACSFRDVHGTEAGDNLEMSFPGGGVVVIENFSQWIAAKGATISDCVCGGVNPADFIIALGLNPEDVLPASGEQGGPQGAQNHPSFAPGPGPEILGGLEHPHILPPTALGYGTPEPEETFLPVNEEKDTVEPPVVTMVIGVDGQGECVEEDSVFDLGEGGINPDNQVAVHANAVGNDVLTQLVITGFNQEPGWTFDFDGMNQPGVTSVVFNAATGTLTIAFGPGVTSFDGTFGVTPPPDSDVDLGTLTATATAAANDDPNNTLDSSTTLDVTVDANADQPVVTTFVVHDNGSDGSFSPNETGTVHVQATFGDFTDGSETHTVTVEIPVSFSVTDPAGGTVTENDDGSHTVTFEVPNGTGNLDANIGIQASNDIASHEGVEFHATATATETTTDDDECDTSPEDNIATDTATTTTNTFDDHPTAYDNKQCVNEGATQNVMIIADVSGSMDDDDISPAAGFQTRLDLEKAALTALVDKYAALDGTVTITLVAFASGADPNLPGGTDADGARNLGTFTFSSTSDQGYLDAIAAINSLAIGMEGLQTETEYDDALILAQNLLTTQLAGQTEGTSNTVYFLSDGVPNPLSNGAGSTGWQPFVNANNIAVVAVGIGDDVSAAELDKVENGSSKAVLIDDQGDLAGLLTNATGNAHVSGNVLLDPTEEAGISPADDPVGSVDKFGSDGAGDPAIVDLVVDGKHYNENSAVDGSNVLANDGKGTVTFQTDLGGVLQFNFETGDYTYTAPDKVDHGSSNEVDERFTYTIQDNDGDTDPADLVICIKDNVEPPSVTMGIGVDGKGECVEEDSFVNDPDNQVAVHAAAQNDDTLTKLVITGFSQEPGWTFNTDGLKTAGVNVGASDLDASDGTVTLVFNPGVKVFDGKFGVQPPADSDVDLGTLTATATAAAAGDPTQTLSSDTKLDVTVDANADPVEITAFAVSDSGGDGSFSPNETGTLHLTGHFGDSQDGSETHTVTVKVDGVFNVTDPAGGVVTDNPDGSHTITFTLDTTGGSDDFSAGIGIQATNAIAQQQYTFDAHVVATETTTGDDECDPSDADNVATADKSTTTQGFDDHPTAYDNKQCVNEGGSQNVVIIADVSGSMDDDDLDPGPGVLTRIDLEKLALAALVDKYAALAGTVTITLIAFSSGPVETAGGSDTDGALNLGTFTFDSTSDPGYAAAIAAISSLAVGLGPLNTETEYDDALITAQNVLTAQLPGQADGTSNTVYFLSDGEPNPASNNAGATGWKAFVDSHNIEVVAVGMGDDIAGSATAIAALTAVEDDGDTPIIVNDKGDLAGVLADNPGNASVSGNVLTDPTEEANISPANDPIGSVDKFGNDGAGDPKITDLVVDGKHYNENSAVGGDVVANDGKGAVTIQTDLGGTLTFNFETGDYTYIAPDKVQHGPPGSATDIEVDERFTYTIQDKDGDTDPADLVICIQDGVPTAADDVNLVQESALDLNKDGIDLTAGLVAGSNPASKAETVTGNLMGNDNEGPDGASITAIKFNGNDVTDASDGKADGFIDVNTGHSLLHVNATTGDYTYTLYDKTSGDGVKDVFNYTLTDGDGDQAKANLTVTIVDDVPNANNDTDSVGAGGKATGNVITGAGTTSDGPGDDVTGADGATVTDIDFGATDGDVGKGIAGTFGTLIINADGSYEYQAKANVSGTDVFTYTLTDGDGDIDTATLTINVSASTPSVAPAVDEVHEASLDANKDGLDLVAGKVTGSNPADTDETETGKLVFSDPDGASISKITFNATDFTDGDKDGFIDVDTGHGKLHVNAATGDYTYTLYDKTGGDGVHDDFGYTVTDTIGNAASSSLTVNIVDDIPNANNDTDSVGAGGKATGNVITGDGTTSDGPGDDVTGADGAVVTDIDFGATDGDVGKAIAGTFGTLILNADGSYEYQAKANVSGTDVFTYTLTDGDGDVDTATLTINVGASTPSVAPAVDEVHEASLDLNKDGLDLVAGKVTGSNPADTDETETGKLVFSDPDGAAISKLTFNAVDFTDGDKDGFIDVDTGHGKLHVNAATGDYTYTLYDKTSGDGVHDDFGYTVTDTFGNGASSTLTVNIVDDVPNANNDKDSVGAGGKATGNVITGDSTSTDGPGDDVKGADGATVTDIDFGATDGDVGKAIAGNFGTLILNGDGSYEYQAKANVSGTDVFTYTLTDGDGDTDTATLTIDVGGSNPVVNPTSNTVNEAALDLNKDGNDLAGGTTTGSNPGSTGETVQGTLVFSDPDGASISKITFNGTDFTDAGDGKADGIISVNTPLGLLAVDATSGAYTYTLETNSLKHTAQGTGIDGVNESFSYTVADKLGNTNSSSLVISVQDDVPHANADTKNTADTQPQDINLVIVFDRSGSMADDPGAPGYSTRLELAKAAVAALFEAYQSVAQDLHIKIVDFSTDANHTVWLDSVEEANAYLAGLSPDGTTHYNDAVQELIGNYNTAGDPVPDADRTEVYFISDGKPNPTSQSLSASGTVAQWQNFLADNDVDTAFAIGVGAGIPANDGDLEDVAFGQPSIVVTNEGQLLATLVGTVAAPPVTGNVITDATADVFGADGKGNGGVGLVSVAFNGHTYTYNQATNEIRNEANVLVSASAVLSLNTTLGGTFEFHFDTGAYGYTAPNVNSAQVETFTYTIADGDGDKSSAVLTINVTDAGGNVVTPLAHIGTNAADNINESAAAADIIISGGLGNDTLTGGAHNDHMQGGTGNDVMNGGAGTDILIGGGGADTVTVGTGDIAESGETSDSFGDDLIILKDNVNFGHVDGGFATSADLAGNNTRGDILAFDGTLDLTALANSKIEGIETISMTEAQGGSGDSTDTLTLNASDVIDLGTGHFNPNGSFNPTGPVDFGTLADKDAIKVDGEAGDTVNLSGGGWFNAGAANAQGGPNGYNLYVHDAGGGNEDAYVLVQAAVTVNGAS